MINYLTPGRIVTFILLLTTALVYPHDFYYVKQDAAGSNNGSSWANAFNNLQDAIAVAAGNDTIFVAKGTYYPDRGSGVNSGDRTASFMLKHGVVLMGGYVGNEVFEKYETGNGLNNFTKYHRNWQVNKTILSGDLSGNDNSNISPDEPSRSDNSIHVISSLNPLDTTAEVNGFYISDGNANSGSVFQQARGGGLYISGSTMQIKNCAFQNNTALESGGAVFANSGAIRIKFVLFDGNVSKTGAAVSFIGTDDLTNPGKPSVVNCFFSNNISSGNGAGVYAINGVNPYISNAVFSGNNSGSTGAGVYADNKSYPEITNSTFFSNTAVTAGGGTTLSGGRISNSIFRNNAAPSGPQIYEGTEPANSAVSLTVISSVVQGGFSGSQVYDLDPLFVDSSSPLGGDDLFGTMDDGLNLQSSSPVIDSGLTWVNIQKSDILGYPRQSNNVADYGAYEHQRFTTDYKNLYDVLKTGGYILLFRHGVTDMSQTDQEGYLENLENCDLQRNLSPAGIKQLEFISSAVKLLGLPLDTSLVSPMCRTRETGRIIAGSYITSIAWMGADSNYTGERIADLGRFTKENFNSVISTHMNSIEDVTTVGRIEVQEGDAIIIKPLGGNIYEEIGHITTDTWEKIINYLPANTTGISDPSVEISGFYLSDNYPNPFNPVTTIEYTVPAGRQVTIKVFDALGREVKNLVNEFKSPGNYKVQFNAADISSGVYFYTLNAGEFSQTKKLMILK